MTTETEAVPPWAMSEARILALSREELTKVVARGLPFHLATDAEKNPVPFTVRLNPAPPGAMASGTRGWLITGERFAPARGTVGGLPSALSVIDKAARRGPACVGVKVTLMLQLARGTTEPLQVLVWAKSPASAPVMGNLVIASVAVP